jgi:hypothetical protein
MTTKRKPRAPESFRKLLRDALFRMGNGPASESPDDPFVRMESDEYRRGYAAAMSASRGWRDSWLDPNLRQVLAYLDGEYTAGEIANYSMGCNYGRNEKSKS